MTPEEFVAISRLVPEPMFLVTGQGDVVAANKAAAQRLGVHPRDVAGSAFASLLCDSPEVVERYLLTCARSGDPMPGSLALRLPGGEALPCRAEGVVVRPRAEGAPALIVLRLVPKHESPSQFAIVSRQVAELNEEIARRKRLERAQREQRNWLEVTLSSIGDGVIATDNEGRVLFMNPVAQVLTGWPQDEALGQPLEEVFRIVNHGTREPVESPATRVLREGRVVGLANDTVLLSRDGSEWPIADSGAPIRDESGRILGVVLVFLEITERQAMEAALRRQTEDLLSSNRRKDEYIAMLAHELRNPLGALSNAVVLLEQAERGSPSFERAREVVRRQLRHQVRMVDDLLDVSRITRGTFHLRREWLDLRELCAQVVEDHRHRIDGTSLQLRVELPPQPVWILGDPARLSQVVANLLTNAVKFTPTGGTVDIRLSAEDGRAVLTVSDTGIGIGSELLPRVFEAFVQGEQNLARTRGGLGLGLSLVKGVVELHQGEVSAASPGPTQGAVFTVSLPLASAGEMPAAPPPTRRAPGGPLRVLVIDDISDAAETMRDMLELWGHTVETALGGAEGVDTARRFRPHVVICDLGLPAMDGYAVARTLKGDPRTAGIPLLALTGYGGDEARRRCREVGFAAHLTKPVDVALLRRLLDEVAASPDE
ncbi:MAG: ATP-binding protein [Armatimonadota bacterium]